MSQFIFLNNNYYIYTIIKFFLKQYEDLKNESHCLLSAFIFNLYAVALLKISSFDAGNHVKRYFHSSYRSITMSTIVRALYVYSWRILYKPCASPNELFLFNTWTKLTLFPCVSYTKTVPLWMKYMQPSMSPFSTSDSPVKNNDL